ncbi:basic leucine zipper 43-like [Populus alba x Populus x berolinensis]|nr:basic leucine zipper 43-like [Populus alba x Populus x berolinensis]
MLPGELTGIRYLTADQNLVPFPANFGMMQQSNIPSFHFNRLLSNLQNSSLPQPVYEFAPQSSSLSNNSTSDESEEHQLSIIDERKQRRMISNRESARRSRMRKQKHLDELWSQVVRLRTENHNLIDKLSHVSECHDRVLQENARLKQEASDFRQMLTDFQQIASPYTTTALRDLEEVPATRPISELNPQTNPSLVPWTCFIENKRSFSILITTSCSFCCDNYQ